VRNDLPNADVGPYDDARGDFMTHRKNIRIALLVAVLCLWTVEPAAAAPMRIRRDRSDNTMTFTYNAVKGQIKAAASSVFWKSGDRVEFLSYVVERDVAVEGKRLKARIVLRLNRDRAVRYDGRFRFIIQDETGTTVFRRTQNVDLVLRPRRGERRRYLRWILDLPSGKYTAFARFRAP
jgi:hypothetical protein